MVNKIILSLLLIFSTTYLSAVSIYVPASYTTAEKETYEGLIRIPTDLFGKPLLQYMQDNIEFVNRKDEVTILKANEIIQFRFDLESETYLYYSFINQIKPKVFWSVEDRIFMQVVEQGKLTLLIGYNNKAAGTAYRDDTGTSGGSGTVASKEYYLHKKGEALKIVRRLSFRKYMRDYFKDCPELIEEITNKKLKIKDLPEIVMTYNLLKSQ